MMYIATILPILIVFAIVFTAANVFKKNARNLLNTKISRILLMGYFTILLTGAVLSLFLPMESSVGKVASGKKVMKQADAFVTFHQEAQRGNFVVSDAIQPIGTWEIPVTGDLMTLEREQEYLTIFVEHSQALVGRIEATHYVGKTYIDGVESTERRNKMNLHMEKNVLNVLKIGEPVHQEIKLAKFTTGIPFTQFSERNKDFFDGTSHWVGDNFLYVKVPEDMRVNGMFVEVNIK